MIPCNTVCKNVVYKSILFHLKLLQENFSSDFATNEWQPKNGLPQTPVQNFVLCNGVPRGDDFYQPEHLSHGISPTAGIECSSAKPTSSHKSSWGMLTNGDNPLPSQTARTHLDVDVISTSDQLKPAYNIGMPSVTISRLFLEISKKSQGQKNSS